MISYKVQVTSFKFGKRSTEYRNSKPVSQFTGCPVEELKSGWLIASTSFHLITENLYLKLTTRINWLTGKQGNWVTKLTGRLVDRKTKLIRKLENLLIG